MSEIKGRQRGQVFYAQRRIKSEKQREQIRLAEKKKFDRSLIDKAKQELRNFLGQNVNEGAEVVVEPVVTNNNINNNNRPEGAEGHQPGEGEDRRREVQARLDQLVEENKTERKKEQERRSEVAEREGILRTKAMREREEQKSRRKYRYCLIRSGVNNSYVEKKFHSL